MISAVRSDRRENLFAEVVTEMFRREPLFAGAALCLAVVALPTLVAICLDDRTLLGINVWAKPLKFEVALSVYLATLAWFAGWLPQGTTGRMWYRTYSVVIVACIAAEIIWIVASAAYGKASHFNIEMPVLSRIYLAMGAFAVVRTSATLVYGVLIWRDGDSGLAPAFKLAVAIGLLLTFVATVAVAGFMAAGPGHFIGGSGNDTQGLAIMGWSRDGGDLRVAHFFATHAMHFIAAFGFVISRTLPTAVAQIAVIVFSIVFAWLIAFTFLDALAGRPILQILG